MEQMNNNHGTAVNEVLFGEDYGVVSEGADFDGLEKYITSPSMSIFRTNEFTFSAWINPKDWDNRRILSPISSLEGNGSNPDSASHHRGWMEINSSGKISARIGSYSGGCYAIFRIVTSDLIVSKNEWSFVTMVAEFSPIFKMKLFVNGNYQGVSEYTTSCGNDLAYFWIGRRKGTTNNFNGSIDEVRIYNRALSPEEIKSLYELGSAHIEWSEWQNHGNIESGTDYVTNQDGNFFQYRKILTTTDTNTSPYLLDYNITLTNYD